MATAPTVPLAVAAVTAPALAGGCHVEGTVTVRFHADGGLFRFLLRDAGGGADEVPLPYSALFDGPDTINYSSVLQIDVFSCLGDLLYASACRLGL